jgi:3-oxoacyl-[acyl-carrier-protein] synthase II
MNFHMLQALTTAQVDSKTASRPFDRSRSGFVRGEGAAILLLEGESVSKDSDRMAELKGYGSTTDAYRLTDPREDGSCLVRAMEEALKDSAIQASEVGYLSAHGTSTPLNDKMEAQAVARLFGPDLWVSSQKSQIGHTTVAAGAIETAACVEMLRRQILAPNINLSEQDPECPVKLVTRATPVQGLRYIMNNNLAFGGQNICVVLGASS